MEAGGPDVHGHPWLRSEFKASLGYVRLYLVDVASISACLVPTEVIRGC